MENRNICFEFKMLKKESNSESAIYKTNEMSSVENAMKICQKSIPNRRNSIIG